MTHPKRKKILLRGSAMAAACFVLVSCAEIAAPAPEIAKPSPAGQGPKVEVLDFQTGEAARLAWIAALEADLAESARLLSRGTGDRDHLARRIEETRKKLEVAAAAGVVAESPTAGRAAADEAMGYVRILDPKTQVTIWDEGSSSTGRVYTYTQTDASVVITHKIDITITPKGRSASTRSVTETTGRFAPTKFFGTPIALSGIDCDLGTRVSANSVHEASAWWTTDAKALSMHEASCAPPCNGSTGPIDPFTGTSYDPYSAGPSGSDHAYEVSSDCSSPGTGAGGGGSDCVTIDWFRSTDGGATWEYIGSTSYC
jgi:hypothetical protein